MLSPAPQATFRSQLLKAEHTFAENFPMEASYAMHHQNTLMKNRSTGMWLTLLVTCAVLLAAIPIHSQNKKPNKSDDQDVIKVTSNLVSLDVIVKDKKGRPITDLKAQDFTVTENGVPQKIEFFDSTLTTATEVTQSTNAVVSTEKPRTTP